MPQPISLWVSILVATILFSCDSTGGLSAQENMEKGRSLVAAGKTKEAYKHFAAAARKDNSNPEFEWAAAQTAPDRDKAFLHATSAWKGGMKSYPVLNTLSMLSLHADVQQRFKYTMELFAELPESLQTRLYRADILSQFGYADSALAIWKASFDSAPSPQVANKIATAYGQTGRIINAIGFLKQCHERDLLDAGGYTILASSYAMIDSFAQSEALFSEAKRRGRYDQASSINRAMAFMAAGKSELAEKELSEVIADKPEMNTAAQRDARGLLMLIYASRSDTVSIGALMSKVPGEGTVEKAERTFYQGAIQLIAGDTTGRDKLRVAEQLLAGSAAVRLIKARQHLAMGKFSEALSVYQTLPVLMNRAPQIALEIARAHAGAGNDESALFVLSSLHTRGFITKESLSLFRDVASKKQLLDKAQAAQAFLEKQYGNDAQVKWSGAMLAARSGKIDSAITLLEALAQKHPDEPQILRAKLTMLMLRKEYARVIAECDKSSHSALLISLKARALVELGRTPEAIQSFENALASNRNRGSLFEYANFMISIGENNKAAQALKEIVDGIKPEKNKQENLKTAVILNNFAWSAMLSGLFDPKEALKAAQRAHQIAPDNLDIMDTYALALLKNGNNKEVANLLDSIGMVSTTPSLPIHLAQAQERLRDNNKAIRAYRRALEVWDSKGKVVTSMTKEEVAAAVERLSGDNL